MFNALVMDPGFRQDDMNRDVIPAEAGIHLRTLNQPPHMFDALVMDPGFRQDDTDWAGSW